MLMNGILVAISRRDTLRPLGIQFRPLANSVCDTKYHKRCTWMPIVNLMTTYLDHTNLVSLVMSYRAWLMVHLCCSATIFSYWEGQAAGRAAMQHIKQFVATQARPLQMLLACYLVTIFTTFFLTTNSFGPQNLSMH